MKDCLVLLTKTFPFDKGEEFIENEVSMLAKTFEKVIIIATSTADQPVQTRKVPENVSVAHICASQIKHRLPIAAVKFIPFTNFKGYCDSEEQEAIRHSLKRKLYLTYFLAKSELVYQKAAKILTDFKLEQYDSVTFYSYWFYDIALVALKLKALCKASLKRAVSRAHGYDLYTNRNSLNYLPLRHYILQNIDMVYPCSQNGRDYLKRLYPAYGEKVETAYLGTSDYGLSPACTGNMFQIVSCCHIVPIKRVELLAQSLAKLKDTGITIKWIHFGGGDGLEELKKFATENLKFMECHFAGEVKNSELMEFYKKNPVDIFINTSSSEGLPVSIMEACSFGIPAIATNVGGTGEIVRDGETGFLLNSDISPDELAKKIKSAVLLSAEKKLQLRKNCRSLWLKEFYADNNFAKFAQEIKLS
jgi:colanic acid/amylovoran biosynthesis glycosyltransferase